MESDERQPGLITMRIMFLLSIYCISTSESPVVTEIAVHATRIAEVAATVTANSNIKLSSSRYSI